MQFFQRPPQSGHPEHRPIGGALPRAVSAGVRPRLCARRRVQHFGPHCPCRVKQRPEVAPFSGAGEGSALPVATESRSGLGVCVC